MQSSLGENSKKIEKTDFILKIIKFSIPSWIGFIINIVSVVIVTRYFLPDAYGLINTFNASSTLIMGLVCLGLDSGFIRYFFEPPDRFDRNRLFLISVLIPLLLLLVLSAVLLAIASTRLSIFIFGMDNFFLMILLFGNVISLLFIRFVTIYYRMEGNIFLYAILSIAMQLALKGSLVFAALVKPDYEFAILSSVIAMISMVAVFLFFAGRTLFPSRKTYSIAEIQSLKQLFIYSLYTWPVPILLYFNTLATLIIIRVKLGTEAVGIFASVSVFVGVIAVLQAGFSTFWSGYMFENYKTQVLRITRMHDYISFFIIVLMACFVLLRDVMFLLLGAKYQVSKPFFALLLLYPLLLILSETTCYGISIAKKTELLLIVTFSSVLLNLGSIWMLIPYWGLLGACFGSAVAGFVFFAVQSYYGQKYYRSIEHAGRTAFTVFSVVVLAVGNLIFSNSFWGLIALSMTGLLFAGLVYRKEIFHLVNFSKNIASEAI